jgi:hypothetical protein
VERAYRRGCHQTTEYVRRLLVHCTTVEEVSWMLLVAKDVLREMRTVMKADIPQLLDTATTQIVARLKKEKEQATEIAARL